MFLSDIVDQKLEKFLNEDISDLIKKTGKNISQEELKSFLKNHERLPLLKKNLEKEFNKKQILKYDIIAIGKVAEDFINLFVNIALEHYDGVTKKKR